MTMRESFIFYRSFYEAIKDLPRDVQGEIYTAIMEYSLNGNEPDDLKPIARSIFTLMKPQIDRNNKRYENGKQGGRPSNMETKDKPRNNIPETETEPKHNQLETNVKPNENYNDNYNVNEEVVIPKNKNKRIKNELKLNMPFKSEKFLKSWELLLDTPKWKKKLPATLQLALDKVTEYDEEFVIELIEQATIGNWQGLVFQETKNQYQKWLNGKRLQNQEGRSSNSSNRANNTEIFSE